MSHLGVKDTILGGTGTPWHTRDDTAAWQLSELCEIRLKDTITTIRCPYHVSVGSEGSHHPLARTVSQNTWRSWSEVAACPVNTFRQARLPSTSCQCGQWANTWNLTLQVKVTKVKPEKRVCCTLEFHHICCWSLPGVTDWYFKLRLPVQNV